jgi:hypothetical protein
MAIPPESLWVPAEDCTEVRAVLSPDLSEEELPDGMICLGVYAGEATRMVAERLPDALWATLPDEQRVLARRAVVLMTAALLAPTMPQETQKDFGPYSAHYTPAKGVDLAAILRARADDILGTLEGLTPVTRYIPRLFRTAAGGRAQRGNALPPLL